MSCEKRSLSALGAEQARGYDNRASQSLLAVIARLA